MVETGATAGTAATAARSNQFSLDIGSAWSNDPPASRFRKLKQVMKDEAGLPEKAVCNCVLNFLVNGQFDAEHSFVISDAEVVRQLALFLEDASTDLQSEILGMVCAMVKRSRRNVLRCIEAEFVDFLLLSLRKEATTRVLADLIVELLHVLTAFSITTNQLQQIIALLRARNGVWTRYSMALLQVLRKIPQRNGPSEFFSFSGQRGSAITLPPLSKWPPERWTFVTWFYLDPVYGSAIERERPYLYTFGTSKGVVSSVNFVGQSLVLTCARAKGKSLQHCVKADISLRTWYHLTVSYVHNRWSKDEVAVYLDGQLVSRGELNWFVAPGETFDRSFLGCDADQSADSMFSGCIGAVHVFGEVFSPDQIAALFQLGPNYQNQLRFSSESALVDEASRQVLFGDARLSGSLLMLYNPMACDGQLCLNQAPKQTSSLYFTHLPHALMQREVTAVHTISLTSALQVLGGIQVLYPLFSQLDIPFSDVDIALDASHVATVLTSLVVGLLQYSPVIDQQLSNSRGFLVLACQLEHSSASHLTDGLIDCLLHAAQYLLLSPERDRDPALQRQLVDYLLLNPAIWIRAAATVQLRLYAFLASEEVTMSPYFRGSALRRTAAVMLAMHTVKHYYWLDRSKSISNPKPAAVEFASRANRVEVMAIRSHLLQFVSQLIRKSQDGVMEELQALFNYLGTVNEDENLLDVLQMSLWLMAEYPVLMVPAFDQLHGVRVVRKLLASPDERIRILSLKLLGFFLANCSSKQKQETVDGQRLFMLISNRLMVYADRMSLSVYNALFELLCQRLTMAIQNEQRIQPDASSIIENASLLKPFVSLVIASRQSELRSIFVLDLHLLCTISSQNCHIILQLPIWQDLMLSLAYMDPQSDLQKFVTDIVMRIFRTLLYHSIRHEFGGWRVWFDTIAVSHARVSHFEFQEHVKALLDQQTSADQNAAASSDCATPAAQEQDGTVAKDSPRKTPGYAKRNTITPPAFRIPEFRWNSFHLRLLNDVLALIEQDVFLWKSDRNKTVSESLGLKENLVFNENVIHFISSIGDNMVCSCGGLLPLLDACTSATGTVELVETGRGLTIETAMFFIARLTNLIDTFVIGSLINLADCESKAAVPSNVPNLCARIVLMSVIRNVIESRMRHFAAYDLASGTNSGPDECYYFSSEPYDLSRSARSSGAINSLINGFHRVVSAVEWASFEPHNSTELSVSGSASNQFSGAPRSFTAGIAFETVRDLQVMLLPLDDTEKLLQELDILRLQALLYRNYGVKVSHSLPLAMLYVVSVLIVSRYRDILEPPTSLLAAPVTVTDEDKVKEKGSSADASADAAVANVGSAAEEAVVAEVSDTVECEKKDNGNTELPNVEGDQVTVAAIQVDNKGPLSSVADADANAQANTAQDLNLRATDQEALNLPRQLGSQAEKVSGLSAKPNDGATAKIERAIGNCGLLIHRILGDFGSQLSRTFVGSHGQELIMAGLRKLRSTVDPPVPTQAQSASSSEAKSLNTKMLVETVMLLCSQEWQTALHKHAGLAFIELVNEGRLLANATRHHYIRTAVQADFILDKARAEDVQKYADFETLCSQNMLSQLEQEQICDGLVSAAHARDILLARRLRDKTLAVVSSTRGPWCSAQQSRDFWRLDNWEDDSRRRLRLVPNPLGSAHVEATANQRPSQRETAETTDASAVLRRFVSPASQDTVAYVSDEELFNLGVANQKQLEESSELISGSSAVVLSTRCKLIAPGVAIHGTLSVNKSELIFAMDDAAKENQELDPAVLNYVEHRHGRWQITDIVAIFSRRYMLQNVALEIFIASRTAIMFAFADQATVRKVVEALPPVGVGNKCGVKPSRSVSLATPKQLFKLSDVPAKWQRRELSNFDYLMFINTISGRTYNDLNQYPVFPWVLVNYESSELDLSNPSNYRDLSKPVGALNPARKSFFQERYRSWDDASIPAFHYGTHYSTAAYVLNFLIRLEPFTSIHVALQDGRFGNPNRLFFSVAQCWRNCQRDTADVKELIPEFFYMSEMFQNRNGFDFGATDDHARVDNVELPQWARSAEDFVRIHRLALESEFVSCQLHSWIDLIFGYKQRGPEAVRSVNVFYHLTYEGTVNLAELSDPMLRQAVESQICSFGQTPAQLLTEPHPPRSSIMNISPRIFTETVTQFPIGFKLPSNSPIVTVSVASSASTPWVVTVAANRSFTVNKWLGTSQPMEIDSLMQETVAASPNAQSRRILGDCFDERLVPNAAHFVVTPDCRAIIVCGFWDRSVRVFSTVDARVLQVIYSHLDVVTCLARSDYTLNKQYSYLVTGSRDCTLMLWVWNAAQQAIVNGSGLADNPRPRCTLFGHRSELICASLSAELGLVISGSRDSFLVHSLTGDLLHSVVIEAPKRALSSVDDSTKRNENGLADARQNGAIAQHEDNAPELVLIHGEGTILVKYGRNSLATFTINGNLIARITHSEQINAVVLTPDGRHVVVGTERGNLEIRRAHDLTQLEPLPPLVGAVRSLALSLDRRHVIAGASNGSLVVYGVDFSRWHEELGTQNRYLM